MIACLVFILTGPSVSAALIYALGSLSQGSYMWQLVQPVAEHELQDELPPIGADSPSPLLETEEKEESIRLAL